jgi:uncharacterized integral membrane protein (TIGR00698 family)
MMTSRDIATRAGVLAPGVFASATIAMAAAFVSDHHGGPTLLYALLIGMAFHSILSDASSAAGVMFCSKTILRWGVALLGARIGIDQIVALGWLPIVIVVLGVVSTIAVGAALAPMFGLCRRFGILTGGAVAICGASAALAIAAALPDDKDKERNALFTVIAVTMLSTIAMVVYPILAGALGYSSQQSGILLGATIHDVAQVVAAGHMVSEEAGLTATFTKLLRVALLLPVVVVIALLIQDAAGHDKAGADRRQLVPWFLVVFAALIVANSLGLVPKVVAGVMSDVSRWCLVVAIAALGIKTSLGDLQTVGWSALALVGAETLFLLVLAVILISCGGSA